MKRQIIIIFCLLAIIFFVNLPAIETFANKNLINIPLTTTETCSNICGPSAICSITKQQCSTDNDCSGCQTSGRNTDPPEYFKGVDSWSNAFNLGNKYSDFKDTNPNMYPTRSTLSGEFIDNGAIGLNG